MAEVSLRNAKRTHNSLLLLRILIVVELKPYSIRPLELLDLVLNDSGLLHELLEAVALLHRISFQRFYHVLELGVKKCFGFLFCERKIVLSLLLYSDLLLDEGLTEALGWAEASIERDLVIVPGG